MCAARAFLTRVHIEIVWIKLHLSLRRTLTSGLFYITRTLQRLTLGRAVAPAGIAPATARPAVDPFALGAALESRKPAAARPRAAVKCLKVARDRLPFVENVVVNL